jgi:hypothetical protein
MRLELGKGREKENQESNWQRRRSKPAVPSLFQKELGHQWTLNPENLQNPATAQ